MADYQHSLIIAIVNTGFTDLVMNAAREHGAKGGTVTHARGTGTKEFEKIYGITLSEGKEMVLIIVKKDIEDKVLKAINDAAGLQSEGRGIAFSLPVEAVAGLKEDEPKPQTIAPQTK